MVRAIRHILIDVSVEKSIRWNTMTRGTGLELMLTIGDLLCPNEIRLHPSDCPTYWWSPPYRFEVMQLA